MKKPSKKFWHGLLITIIVLGTMYGVAIYMAIDDRQKQEKFRRWDKERYERLQKLKDSVQNVQQDGKPHPYVARPETDDDPYDDPEFDDVIPGEEYDEEFVERSKGDPELYQ